MNENYDVQNLDIQDTTPDILGEDTKNIVDDEKDIVTPDDSDLLEEDVMRDTEAILAQKSVSENTAATEPFISVQYNHKNRDFTREEAINFIQKGMHTESLRAKLEYLAKSQGLDVNSLVEKIVLAPEKAYRAHLEQMYGKDSSDVEIGMAIYREKQSDEYKKLMRESESNFERELEIKSVNSRLADEYINLKKEMPNAPDYSNLPDSVIREAAEGKKDLYSAYLRYLHREKIKIDAAKKSEKSAAAASTGAMKSNDQDDVSVIDKNFLSGLWGR